MAQMVRDVMTPDPVTVRSTDTVVDAARAMRDHDIGPVIVLDNGSICGLLTDRDLVVRGIAEGKDPKKTKAGDLCSKNPTTLSPDQPVDEAVKTMSDKAIRRIPVVENGKPIGMVSLGDLAIEKDPSSALGAISAASPNN